MNLALSIAVVLSFVAGLAALALAGRLPAAMERGWRAEAKELLAGPSPPAAFALHGRLAAGVLAVTVAVSVGVVLRYGASWHAAAGLMLVWALVALALIDARHSLLPDLLVLPLIWLGLLVAGTPAGLVTTRAAVMGAAVGYVTPVALNWIFHRHDGATALGRGDAKLFAAAGAWMGLQPAAWTMIAAGVLAGVASVPLILTKRRQASEPLPFGPWIALAAAGWYLAGPSVWAGLSHLG